MTGNEKDTQDLREGLEKVEAQKKAVLEHERDSDDASPDRGTTQDEPSSSAPE